jgi:peptidoglycan/xylan/chitin deacetylase (PgdA/CDA1 family)/glycosyltransferase involved in cell wall biosynthesis
VRRPQLACLLPVRNGEADLPGYFESVRGFADTILALDDGSTDGTRELLESEPLVSVVLGNPRRPDFRGWDDAGNRNRLLEAAEQLEPHWIISLDADERIGADEGAALRRFVESDAIRGYAYGFRVFRMWEDLEHYTQSGLWVYRLFSGGPGLSFPSKRLHFVPVPRTIPRHRWIRTTIRIQHLASLTPERRALRFAKYEEADPNNEFQHSYRDLLSSDDEVRKWEPRPAGLPVIHTTTEPEPYDEDQPALSAIVISRDDEDVIERSVASVVEQRCEWPFEVIVVTSGSDRTADVVRENFPSMRLVELPDPALPGEARNAGLRVARGDYVSFPGSHVELPEGSLEARRQAHDLGYAMVTGSTLNGTRTKAGWASYFLDHHTVLPNRPSTELPGAPAHCSYNREALLEVGGFPEDLRAGEDTVVNKELADRGYVAYRAADVTLIHSSPCRTIWKLLSHHFVRGRGYGRIMLGRASASGSLVRTARRQFRSQVRWRLRSTHRHVRRWGGELNREYDKSTALVALGATSAWIGTCYELWQARFSSPAQRSALPVPQVRVTEPARAASKRVEPASNAPTNVPILLYHRVDIPGTKWSVTEEQLRWQLAWLRSRDYESVTVSQILDSLRGLGSLALRSVAITIDDGARDAPRFAEILAEYGYAGTYFVPTEMGLSPTQVRELAVMGGEIGGHTTSHPDLSKLDRRAQLAEVADNKAFLEDLTGKAVRSFSYPYGMYDGHTVEVLKEAGYGAAVDGDNGYGRPLDLRTHVDPFHLPRFAAVGHLTNEQFAFVLQA